MINQAEERYEYAVEKAAVNAVMAGARPEHFPVIPALAASQEPSMPGSTTSFGRMVIVNGLQSMIPGGTFIMDPLVAKNLKEREGFKTKEEFRQWLLDHQKKTCGPLSGQACDGQSRRGRRRMESDVYDDGFCP